MEYVMRARNVVLMGAGLALLAGCGSAAGESESDVSAQSDTPTATESARVIDPDAPEGGIIDDSDAFGIMACEDWTQPIPDDSDLHEATERIAEDFSAAEWGGPVRWETKRAVINNAERINALCGWNGFEPQPGSPSDALS